MVPLRSGAAAAWMCVLLICCSGYSFYQYFTRLKSPAGGTDEVRGGISIWVKLLLVALAGSIIFFAVAALGPVTNYDSGLYHLGAIKYAGDYSTIPGLANIYFPLGYNNSLFPIAAFLGNGPWSGEGYRLVNGLIITMMLIDLAFRWTRGSRTVGAYVLLIGAVVTLVPMVALSDYWVTSPSSDSAVLALTMVVSAYLADALWSRTNRARNGSTAFVVAVLAVSLRPLMAVFLLGVMGVLIARFILDRRVLVKSSTFVAPNAARVDIGARTIWIWAGAIAAAFAVIQSIRDYILSGWLQFPLSLHPFSVAWIAPDPVWNRTPTLGAARDPLHLWEAAVGWGWIPAWTSRLPSQWETYVCIALAASAVLAMVVALKIGPLRARALMLAMLPAAITCVAWFLASPPSFRFAWGPLFSLGVIPIGWALFVTAKANKGKRLPALITSAALAMSSVAILLVVAVTSLTRLHPGLDIKPHTWALGPFAVEVNLAPIVDAPTKSVLLDSGLVIKMPTASDQCWNVYPLCTAQLSPSVEMRGATLQDGFLP